MKTDAISIVEAAYDISGDDAAWLRQLIDRATPALDRGLGMLAWRYRIDGAFRKEVEVRGPGDPRALDAMAEAPNRYNSEAMETCAGHALRTGAQMFGLSDREAEAFPPFVDVFHPAGVRDGLRLNALDASGCGVMLVAPQPDFARPSRAVTSRWDRIAVHLAAGARLRDALGAGLNPLSGASAILDPNGSVLHVDAEAKPRLMRDELRQAARTIDRARSNARSNEDEALELWQGLVAGRWSLIEQFDSDGRRFMVARRNDPQVTDPRALSLRERQVLAYVAMGHPAKLIAYALGVAPSLVSLTRRTAMRKLGLKTTVDVVRLFAGPPGSPAPQDF